MCGFTKSNETSTEKKKYLSAAWASDDRRQPCVHVCAIPLFSNHRFTCHFDLSTSSATAVLEYIVWIRARVKFSLYDSYGDWREGEKKNRKKQCKKAIITPMKHHRNDKENGGKKFRPVRSMISLSQRGNISRRGVWAECIVTTEYTPMLNICRHCSMPWPIKIIFMNLSLAPEPIHMWRSAWEQQNEKKTNKKNRMERWLHGDVVEKRADRGKLNTAN